MNQIQDEILIVTHEGKQHADEALACWMLKTALGGHVKILRSDDPAAMSAANFVVDCGGLYDPIAGRYDHHGIATPEPPSSRWCGYSAAGLVWKDYGRKVVRRMLAGQAGDSWRATLDALSEPEMKEIVDCLFHELDHDIVAPIDRWDLGMRGRAAGVLPVQWLIPHMPFEIAMDALGYAMSFRTSNLLSYSLGARKLQHDLLENDGCTFWLFDNNWLVVVASQEHRLDVAAANRFMEQVDDPDIRLLAVVSPIKRGQRWTGIFMRDVPESLLELNKFQILKDHRTVFHGDWRAILDLGRSMASFSLANDSLI